MKYSFKNVLVKAVFTLTVFDILLMEGRSVLQPAQWIAGSERVMSSFFNIVKKDRSSHRRYSVRNGVLRNLAKFTGKHLCQSPFFNKAAGLILATLSKKSLWPRCFPVNFGKFLRTPFFTEHLWVTASENSNLLNEKSEKSFIVSLSFVSIC